MEGSVLSFLKAEWKVSDTGSAHWTSSFCFVFGEITMDKMQMFLILVSLTPQIY
jgi:hypothetical protein